MMFFRMLKGALLRQKSKMLLIALTVALGTSLSTSMLNVMLDVGDKVNNELKAYGANITVMPKQSLVLSSLYGENSTDAYLNESSLLKLKTIFWAYNIVDFAPNLQGTVEVSAGEKVEKLNLKGTWFSKHVVLPTGEEFTTGMDRLKSWWELTGGYPKDVLKDQVALDTNDSTSECTVGINVAHELNLKLNSVIEVSSNLVTTELKVVGIVDTSSDDDDLILVNLPVAQKLFGKDNLIGSIEVSALTTPDNDLSRRASVNPNSLSMKEMETWYCTAYVSSICYQIEEAIPDAIAKAVRQVAESEGAILEKTQLLMTLITLLSLFASALGIPNLVTTQVMEQSREIGLLKAIGAFNYQIVLVVLSSILIAALVGASFGYFVGIGFAKFIGYSVFNAAIDIKTLVIPLVAVLVLIVTLLGSMPAIHLLLSLRPARVLHGGNL